VIRANFEIAEEVKLAQHLATYEIIIVDTVKERDEFDWSPNGKKLKSLQEIILRFEGTKLKPNIPLLRTWLSY
jgi:hypothetical protein